MSLKKYNWMDVWPRFEGKLREAIEHEVHEFDIEDVVHGLQQGHLQFWNNESAAVVTDIVTLASRNLGIQVVVAGGTYDGVMDLMEDIEQWAREKDFESILTIGRVGWNRTPRARQWRHTASLFVKHLKEH